MPRPGVFADEEAIETGYNKVLRRPKTGPGVFADEEAIETFHFAASPPQFLPVREYSLTKKRLRLDLRGAHGGILLVSGSIR